ncbi:hypothetical protein SPLC1_S271380 [Arthrospira platensis C1]|uniref:Uncharacterized protein n=1 Tax=Limnospira maxima CS-328 TaxID=513049 RepID=B5W8M3_LIMMA|nr:hypothetical protein AmaxDRAFT_5123 [Limnospira maxima CS-328]EKD08216.1 hypothetical protein SPLC1_S271380 [Arthrospira platensis C1]
MVGVPFLAGLRRYMVVTDKPDQPALSRSPLPAHQLARHH